MVVEVVVGIIASSLALLSDAAHMLTDAAAIGLALLAATLAARPPSRRYTFGLGRAEILSARQRRTLLVLRACSAGGGAAAVDPPDVEGGLVIVVGALGACQRRRGVGAVAVGAARAQRRGARAHVLADLYGSLAAVVAGLTS